MAQLFPGQKLIYIYQSIYFKVRKKYYSEIWQSAKPEAIQNKDTSLIRAGLSHMDHRGHGLECHELGEISNCQL